MVARHFSVLRADVLRDTAHVLTSTAGDARED